MRVQEVFGVTVRQGEITQVTDVRGNIARPEQDTMSIIKSSPHCREDEDFWCTVGQKDGMTNILFKRAIPLTEGANFQPNTLGIRLYGDVMFNRGWKPRAWVNETNLGQI